MTNSPPAKPIYPFFPRTFSQLVNLLKIGMSLGVSLVLRRPYIWGNPVIAHIEPTSLCNLHCPLCPSGTGELTRQRTKLNFDQFKIIMDKIPPTVRMLLLWNQGEPFMVKDFLQMVSFARQKKLYIVTSTNGHFFHNLETAKKIVQSGIDELIVSLDGADQESYQKYRIGGNLSRVIQGIKNLSAAKDQLNLNKPLIHLQFILMKHNIVQRDQMIDLGREMGADKLSFKTLQMVNRQRGNQYLPEDQRFTRYRPLTDTEPPQTKKRRFFANDCLRLWYSMVINCDGQVSPCCFDKDAEFPVGNLLTQSFASIWRGEQFRKFRRKLLDSRFELEMCQDCTEGVQNLFTETIDYRKN
ncbi:MAG: SPASM domain-containing protein [bacterium]|nr:MAG: SPASM domain-containing protein [bacterium]